MISQMLNPSRPRSLLAGLTVVLLSASALPVLAQGLGHGSPAAVRDIYSRGLEQPKGSVRQQNVEANRFGRLFEVGKTYTYGGRKFVLQAHPSDVAELRRLGRIDGPMHEKSDSEVRDSNVPAGYVFFGQFIDHDVTFDTISSLDKPITDNETENARTPTLDLDNIYGGGPERSPYLFNLPYLQLGAEIAQGRRDLLRRTTIAGNGATYAAKSSGSSSNAQAQSGSTVRQVQQQTSGINLDGADAINDLLLGGGGNTTRKPKKVERNQPPKAEAPKRPSRYGRPGVTRDVALIGDPRNDENVVISQLQAAFISYHNWIADRLMEKDGVDLAKLRQEAADAKTIDDRMEKLAEINTVSREIYERARNHTIHYYHRMIVEDFLPRIVGLDRVQRIRTQGRRFYFPKGFIDRSTGKRRSPNIPVEFSVAAYRYGHSQVRGEYKLKEPTPLVPLFGLGQGPNATDMRGFTPIDYDRLVDWSYFVPMPGSDRKLLQSAKPIDTRMPTALFRLSHGGIVPPGDVESLASRNLNRGRVYGLPSGQAVARAMGLRRELILEADGATVDNLGVKETPLWYYIVQEAKQQGIRPVDAIAYSLAKVGRLASSKQVYQTSVTTAAAETGRVKQLTGSSGGDILGPVGGTIVGEVLLGLIDHYRETTNRGLAFPSEIDDKMTYTDVAGVGRSYHLGNMLHDVGLSARVR